MQPATGSSAALHYPVGGDALLRQLGLGAGDIAPIARQAIERVHRGLRQRLVDGQRRVG